MKWILIAFYVGCVVLVVELVVLVFELVMKWYDEEKKNDRSEDTIQK